MRRASAFCSTPAPDHWLRSRDADGDAAIRHTARAETIAARVRCGMASIIAPAVNGLDPDATGGPLLSCSPTRGRVTRLVTGRPPHRLQRCGDGRAAHIYIKIVWSNEPERLLYSARRHLHLTSWSPDGKWLAYASNEGGSSEVNVVSFPSLIRVVTGWLDEVLASEAAPR